jgi:hypothetical protein
MFKQLTFSLLLFGLIQPPTTWALLGDLPAVNSAQGTSVINLNFGTPGSNQQIALFLINSNTVAGFHLTFNFFNLGNFKIGTRQFPMTALKLNKISGTLGGGLTEPVNVNMLPLDGSGNWIWSPGAPTSETTNYLIEITASWDDQSSKIAGFYQEAITCTIAAGP